MNDRQQKRKRGVFLSDIGYQRLNIARTHWEQHYNFGGRYTIEQLSEITELAPNTLNKIFIHNTCVDKSTLGRCFKAFGAILTPEDCEDRSIKSLQPQAIALQPVRNRYLSWGEAPDISIFYGRDRELATLTAWIERDRCRLVSIVGMGGIGKTSLATKLADRLQGQFTTVCWRSLRNAPMLSSLLPDLIQVCSQERDIAQTGSTIADRISQLLHHLSEHRCLLVLDNIESILQGGNSSPQAGVYRQEYADYHQLFERIGTSLHQSCYEDVAH